MKVENYEDLMRLVNELDREHPEHKLSLFYVGNRSRWGDDRGWGVSTRYLRKPCRTTVAFRIGGTENVERPDPALGDRITHWVKETLPKLLADDLVESR